MSDQSWIKFMREHWEVFSPVWADPQSSAGEQLLSEPHLALSEVCWAPAPSAAPETRPLPQTIATAKKKQQLHYTGQNCPDWFVLINFNIAERNYCQVIVWRQHKAEKWQKFRKWSRQMCTAESVHQFYSVLLLRELLRLTFVHLLQRLLVFSLLLGQQRLIMLDGVVLFLWFKSTKNATWRFVLEETKQQKRHWNILWYISGNLRLYALGGLFLVRHYGLRERKKVCERVCGTCSWPSSSVFVSATWL